MRIAVLCTDQGVRVPGDKGASLHLLAVTRAFARLGHDVLLLGVAGHGAPPPDLTTHLLPHPGRAEGLVRERNKLALTEHFVTEAGPVLADFGPDVIYERLALFGTAGQRLAAAAGARHVVEVNALLAQEEATWRGLTLAEFAVEREQAVLAGADHIIAVSAEWADGVRRLAGADVPITVVPNGFDEEVFAAPVDREATRAAYGMPPLARLVVFAGTLRPWHGVDVAIRALTALPADVGLVVVGDGPVRDELEALAATLGVAARVHVLGQLPHDRTAAVLGSCDVGIAPYPALEDFAFSPLKLYEYLAAGLPFVASDVGQIHSVATEFGSGQLVRPGDPVELAAAVGRALADPFVAARAQQARALAHERCGWTARAQQIIAVVQAPVLTGGPR